MGEKCEEIIASRSDLCLANNEDQDSCEYYSDYEQGKLGCTKVALTA